MTSNPIWIAHWQRFLLPNTPSYVISFVVPHSKSTVHNPKFSHNQVFRTWFPSEHDQEIPYFNKWVTISWSWTFKCKKSFEFKSLSFKSQKISMRNDLLLSIHCDSSMNKKSIQTRIKTVRVMWSIRRYFTFERDWFPRRNF